MYWATSLMPAEHSPTRCGLAILAVSVRPNRRIRSSSAAVGFALALCGAAAPAAAAQDASVDFARDVQPIFRTYCVGCHGPTIHHNGFRLDRRSDALRGGTIPVIGPGNAEASRLYLRL